MMTKYSFDTVAGLTIHIHNDNSISTDGCLLVAQRNNIHIRKKFTGVNNLEGLIKIIPVKTAIAVNLTGKGILTKRIDRIAELDTSNFNKVLPNGNIEDYYTQNFISGEYSFISLIRQSDANKIFNQLTAIGYYPVMLTLGPFVIGNIINDTNLYNERITINGHRIERDDQGNWISYSYESPKEDSLKIKIQTETLSDKELMPYAAAFQLILTNYLDVIKAKAENFDELFLSKQSEQKFKSNGLLILSVFFVLLLVNFAIFSWVDSSNNKLQAQLSKNIQNTKGIKQIADQIKNKELLLNNLGWDKGLRKSILIDRIAAVLPTDITWTSIALNPVNNSTIYNTKALSFSNNRIEINGLSEKVLSVNEWLARVKTLKWVKKAELENYAYNHELNSGVFTINIVY